MSQDDRTARDRDASPEPEVLGDDDVAPDLESRDGRDVDALDDHKPSTHRRAKLVLADSVPPPPPSDGGPAELEIAFGAPDPLPGAPEIGLTPPCSAPLSEPADAYLGRMIADRYEVEDYLGRGSMGTVYSCRHRVLGKRFAVKIIRQDLARDAEALSRFVTEAKAASAIGSKHIVEVFDFGELPDGAAYIVMEQLEGTTLYRKLVESPRLPPEQAIRIAIQIADAVGAAHAAGVVHRDLKPDNVFLVETESGEDFVKILDFGIAKVLTSGSKLTQAGSVMGTPAYMSPEQAMGAQTNARTDVYALGIMLYEMVAGEVPFDAESPLAVLSMQVTEPPPPLATRAPGLPPGYENVAARCLAKKAEERFQSMSEVRQALAAVARGEVPAPSSRSGVAVERSHRSERGGAAPLLSSQSPDFRAGQGKVWLASGLGVAALGALAFSLSNRQVPEPKVSAPPSSVAPAPIAPPPTASVAAKVDAGPTKDVHLILFPLDARVHDGKKDLGMMPITIKLAPGEVRYLTVSRRGYVTRRLQVDGQKSRLVVGLVVEDNARKGALVQAEKAADEAAERAASPSPAKQPAAAPEPLPQALPAVTQAPAAERAAERPASE